MRERRDKEGAREKYMGAERERESAQGGRVCTGGREIESETRGSQTRESRRVDATNARFETRILARTRGERRREHELRVALI